MIRIAWLIAAISMFATPNALAHRSLNPMLKISMDQSVLMLEMGVTADELNTFDLNGDGRISKAEHMDQAKTIRSWLATRIRIESTDGQIMTPSFEDLPVPHYAELAATDTIEGLRLIRRYDVSDSPAYCVSYLDANNKPREMMIWTGQQIARTKLPSDGTCRSLSN